MEKLSKGDVKQGIRAAFRARREMRLPQEGRLAGELHLEQRDLAQQQNSQRIEEMERAEKVRMLELEAESQPTLAETRPEDLEQAELNKIINDFWAKQSQIAEMKAQKTGRFASLAKSLGIKTRSLENDEEIVNLEKESHDLYRGLLAKGINLYKGEKGQLEIFLRQFDEFEVFRETYNQEMEKRTELCGLPENVLAGFQKIGKKWSELKKWQQIVIGAGGGLLMAGGAMAVGAGTFGAFALTAGYRWGFRGFGAMAMGIGRKVSLEKKRKEEMDTEGEKEINEMMQTLRLYENDIDAGIAIVLDRKKSVAEIRKNYEETSLNNTRQAVKLAGKTFVISSVIGESFRLAGQATGINFGSIMKRIGGYVGIGTISESGFPKAPVEIPDIKGHGGGPPMVEGSPAPSGVEPSVLDEMAQKTPVAGAEVHALEIEKPQFEEIASGNFGKGGSVEGKMFQSIKANPSAYGLDPNDPNFAGDAQKMTRNISEEFASRKGFASYEDFDNYCRKHVQSGDRFKIIYNPGTEEIHLDYEGKAFGTDVAKGIPAEEIRVKTPGSEYPASKTASQVRGMEEIEADYKKDLADRKYARAVQAEKDLASLHERKAAHLGNVGWEAHQRQVLATRGLLNRIIEGAGVGNNVSFWEGSALDWHDQIVNKEDYIIDDIQRADMTEKLNLNLGKMRDLFLKLGKPEIGQSMGEYLAKAMENPRNIELINQIISRK